MKRTITLIAVAALAATPTVANAGAKPTSRVVTWSYQGLLGAYQPGVGGGGAGCTVFTSACFDLTTMKYETHVKFSAVDSTGQKVGIQYYFDGVYKSVPTVCGEGDFDVSKGTVVSFDTIATPACPGVPTQGTVTITVTGKK